MGAGHHAVSEHRVSPRTVVFVRHAERRRVRSRLADDLRCERTAVADDDDEVRHAGAPPAALVGLVDRFARRQRVLPVGHNRGQRRLVRHKRPHLLRMLRDKSERADRAAAAGEQVHGSPANRLNEPIQVVGVSIGRHRTVRIGQDAALGPAWVIGDDRAIGEVLRQGAEAGCAHRQTDEQQDRLGAGLVPPNVIRQRCAGDVKSMGRHVSGRRGHKFLFSSLFPRSSRISLPTVSASAGYSPLGRCQLGSSY